MTSAMIFCVCLVTSVVESMFLPFFLSRAWSMRRSSSMLARGFHSALMVSKTLNSIPMCYLVRCDSSTAARTFAATIFASICVALRMGRLPKPGMGVSPSGRSRAIRFCGEKALL